MSTSWDDLRAKTTDGQKAAEYVTYRAGCWQVEEYLIRNEDNGIVGKVVTRTLVSPGWQDNPYRRIHIVDDRPEVDQH